jgi:putative Holliday junction resolvase
MGRILCLDYGLRRTGVAISDPTRTIAQPLCTIQTRSRPPQPDTAGLIAALRRLTKEHEVTELVIGLPLGSTGRPSVRSRQVNRLGRKLADALGLPVHYQNERYSTVRAADVQSQVRHPARTGDRRNRRQTGTPARRCQDQLDRIAAAIILQDYLNSRR